MFGGLRLRVHDRLIDIASHRKCGALLARLALYPSRMHPREELVDLFWPDMDIEAARNNLRQTLWTLRRTLVDEHDPIVCSDRSSVWLAPGSISTDVADFEAAIHAAERSASEVDTFAGVVSLYEGELLSGFYEEWILSERRRLEVQFIDALRKATAELASNGEPLKAVPFALRLVSLDPYNEDVHLSVMALYSAAGETNAVKRQYEELVRLLREELDEGPLPGTEKEAARLLDEAAKNAAAIAIDIPVVQRPFVIWPRWKRFAAAAAAAVSLSLPLGLTWTRGGTAHASPAHSAYGPDDQVAEMRRLRVDALATGTEQQRAAARSRHAGMCLGLAEQAWTSWYGPNEEEWLDRIGRAHDDIRTAMPWLIEHDPDKAVQLSGALTRYFYLRSYRREGFRWLSDALDHASGRSSTARARALVGYAFLSPYYDSGSKKACAEALEIYRRAGDRWGQAHALRHLGFIANANADRITAWRCYQRALDLFTKIKDERGQAITLLCMSHVPDDKSLTQGAFACFDIASRSLAHFQSVRNAWGICMALESLGELSNQLGDTGLGRSLIRQALASMPAADGIDCGAALHGVNLERDTGRRLELYRRSVQIACEERERRVLAFLLESTVSEASGPEVTAKVYGALSMLEPSIDMQLGERFDPVLRRLTAELGTKQFNKAFLAGKKLNWEQAAEIAVGPGHTNGSRPNS